MRIRVTCCENSSATSHHKVNANSRSRTGLAAKHRHAHGKRLRSGKALCAGGGYWASAKARCARMPSKRHMRRRRRSRSNARPARRLVRNRIRLARPARPCARAQCLHEPGAHPDGRSSIFPAIAVSRCLAWQGAGDARTLVGLWAFGIARPPHSLAAACTCCLRRRAARLSRHAGDRSRRRRRRARRHARFRRARRATCRRRIVLDPIRTDGPTMQALERVLQRPRRRAFRHDASAASGARFRSRQHGSISKRRCRAPAARSCASTAADWRKKAPSRSNGVDDAGRGRQGIR